jgi:hypothetical protein
MLVCSGRDYIDRDRLWATLDELHLKRSVARVIAGEQEALDTLAEEWAKSPRPAVRRLYGEMG